MIARLQKLWFDDARTIIRARAAAENSLKNSLKNSTEFKDAKAYFFDVLNNAWLFDVGLRFGHTLLLTSKTGQNNWGYCPFCVHLSSYRGSNTNLNRLWAPLIKGGHKPPTVHCHSVY